MCDYSLMGIPNRLATEGEELVAYKFPTGTMGLASPTDLRKCFEVKPTGRIGFWGYVREMLGTPMKPIVPAVCIPPGARLIFENIPDDLQRVFGVGPTASVIFTQITANANRHRDAVRFDNGREVLLQELAEGQRVLVLDLSSAELRAPGMAESRPFVIR